MTNINPNNDIGKINHNIKKGKKVNKQEKPVAETKSVEASSLNALSAYGKANINFKGNTSLSVKTKNDEISKAEITSSIGEAEETEEYKSPQYEESKDITSITSSETMFTPDVRADIEAKLKTMLDSEDEVNDILNSITEENLPIVQKLLEGDGKKLKELKEYFTSTNNDYDFLEPIDNTEESLNSISETLSKINKENINLTYKILFDDKFTQKDLIGSILTNANSSNYELIETLMFNNKITDKKEALEIAIKMAPDCMDFAKRLCTSESISEDEIMYLLKKTNSKTEAILDELILGTERKVKRSEKTQISDNEKYLSEYAGLIDHLYTSKDKNTGNDLIEDKEKIKKAFEKHTNIDFSLVEKLYIGKDANGNELFTDKKSIKDILFNLRFGTEDFCEKLCFDKHFKNKKIIGNILGGTNSENKDLAEKLSYNTNLEDELYEIFSILAVTTKDNLPIAEKLFLDKKNIDENYYTTYDILRSTNSKNLNLAKQLCFAKNKTGEDLYSDKDSIPTVIEKMTSWNIEKQQEILDALYNKKISNSAFYDMATGEISLKEFEAAIKKIDNISNEHFNKTKQSKTNSRDKLNNLSRDDLIFFIKNIKLYKKSNINELSTIEKNFILKNLIKRNTYLFNISDELKQDFPLIPKNRAEYCSLLKNLVKSMGIQTNEISATQEKEFDNATQVLSNSLSQLSDEEFTNLSITQKYSKEDFIKDVLKETEGLNKFELQKVFDYFGFELKQTDKTQTGYTIVGYPVNLNNGEKLSQIEDEKTKQVIEQLRPYVKNFSETNKISCNNKEIETALNEIAKILPEIRTFIGKTQHGTQHFDIMKHSLKVIQKIVQNPKFNEQSNSDKKILLLASLLHDSAKSEGNIDPIHAKESAFDAFYISQKFNLTKDERIKLYSLIENHEWLRDINKAQGEEREVQLKSKAFDLQYDNLFELSKIFTEADLKAVKIDDSFFDMYKADFEIISKKVESLISTLKESQPLLPVTPIPSSSRIKEAITTVNSDYSTNLKGIYQDENGMIIIKYNEVENDTWEKIGFPKGSISKGFEVKGKAKDEEVEKTFNTGNIKFFIHGLDLETDLAKFDSFTLPDTDALLSVSYAERPESKYRFFRSQGVILNADAKYIHGGGNEDAGSGCCKDIELFKKKYAYEDGEKHEERKFIADKIKTKLNNMSNNDYIKFVAKYKNKPLTEIEEKDQKALIETFGAIESKVRYPKDTTVKREYNEMYITNPEVMGFFTYSDKPIDNVKTFTNTEKDLPAFIKRGSLEKDMPLIIFGD